MNLSRRIKFESVISKRQPTMTVILENVQDFHNLSAVIRTADAVGMMEIYTIYNQFEINPGKVILGKKSSSGSRKWIDVHSFGDVEECFEAVRLKYDNIYGTYLAAGNTKTLYDLDLAKPFALVFGNERYGLSEKAARLCDANFYIPQVGMAESLNVSVAASVCMYEGLRQRRANGMYDKPQFSEQELGDLFEEYTERGKKRKGLIVAERFSVGKEKAGESIEE